MPEFFRVVSPGQVYDELSRFSRVGSECVPLEGALSRVLVGDITAPEDLPSASRATMDGYAVRASDTFGASDSLPSFHAIVGRVEMGSSPGFEIKPGEAAEIPTGGFLPRGSDAVVMVEYSRAVPDGTVEVVKPVTMGENVLAQGADVAKGEVLFSSGIRLRPQDLGLIAGLGISQVVVFGFPRVAVISTGNEIVPITENPGPGEIRDINTYSLSALVSMVGGKPVTYGIVSDDLDCLRVIIQKARNEADVVVLSGGSSVGERDFMADAVAGVRDAKVLVHGVAVSPGKPTLIANIGGKALFGLPGHPVSAMVIAQVFLVPFLKYLSGENLGRAPVGTRVNAVLATSISSAQGREEYVRVKVEERDGVLFAVPVFGKSGMLSTMVKSDGVIVVPIHAEGFARGEEVQVILF